MTGFILQNQSERPSLLPLAFDYLTTVDDDPPRSWAMDNRELNIRNMRYAFGRYCDSSSPFVALSEASSQSTQAYDYADSSSQACHSENGSFYDSPMPASPVTNSLHLFQSPPSPSSFPSPNYAQLGPATSLFNPCPNLDMDTDTPSPGASSEDRITKSSSTNTGRDYPVCCLYPGCNAKPFKRRADLDRHYKHRHASDAEKVSFNCDYPRCSRRKDPFYRLDHFRDHLREFHKEDIEKRGGSVNEESLEDRRVSSTWWRCPKCLKRIYIDRNGYGCPNCKSTCQPKRKDARRRS